MQLNYLNAAQKNENALQKFDPDKSIFLNVTESLICPIILVDKLNI